MIKKVSNQGMQISWMSNFYKKIIINTINPIVAFVYTSDLVMFLEIENNKSKLSIYDENGNILKSVIDNEQFQIGSISTELNNTKLCIVIYQYNDNPYCYYYNKTTNNFEAAHPPY